VTAKKRVAVAMSGGVDSSVAAALLVQEGIEAFGLMLRLWSPDPGGYNRCCSPQDVTLARRVSEKLGIPFYVIDAHDRFKQQVVDPFIEGYLQGVTPNPCLACNRQIRWGYLLHQALAYGATHLATGHYARVEQHNNRFLLRRAIDPSKDQSYVLSVLGQFELSHARFPLGQLKKNDVRELAREMDLPVAERPDSQDLCFIPEGDYRPFLREHSLEPPEPGSIVNLDGETVGQHQGLADFTIGQRRGIGVSMSYPLYVINKDIQSNLLTVGPREALGCKQFAAGPVHWVADQPPTLPLHAQVRVRYKAREVSGLVEALQPNSVLVSLSEALPDITPGQAAVFYNNDLCLGGGIIQP
jgi:tRNA-specific 2-thiouridylase